MALSGMLASNFAQLIRKDYYVILGCRTQTERGTKTLILYQCNLVPAKEALHFDFLGES